MPTHNDRVAAMHLQRTSVASSQSITGRERERRTHTSAVQPNVIADDSVQAIDDDSSDACLLLTREDIIQANKKRRRFQLAFFSCSAALQLLPLQLTGQVQRYWVVSQYQLRSRVGPPSRPGIRGTRARVANESGVSCLLGLLHERTESD